jgi:hypothetical protein
MFTTGVKRQKLSQLINPLTEYYRCPERYIRFALNGKLSEANGYFRFGADTVYGKYCGLRTAKSPAEPLHDASLDTTVKNGTTYLPFDLAQVIDSLRYEQYARPFTDSSSAVHSALHHLYYFIRPLLPVRVRKHLQKVHLSGWNEVPFPHWPVDRTVDNVLERLLLLSLKASGADKIPFIWFWPEGAPSCAIMTHDVETRTGRDFCATLMDIDDSFGIRSSFQVVPEVRYEVTPDFRKSITDRGFGLGVQDLNHDGRLYKDRAQFVARAAKINAYGRKWGAEGFRAGVLYRRQDWFDELDFAYDMSVPNVAHLDPQHGGCCTMMPYFVGKMLELPVTTTQDYPLFHILNDYSIDLWKIQIDLIMEKHGLMSFIVHPDYVIGSRERSVYQALLSHLAQLREDRNVWIAKPDDVNHWWRQRAKMKLIEDENGMRIEGEGRERARIAYASEENGQLALTFQTAAGDQVLAAGHRSK